MMGSSVSRPYVTRREVVKLFRVYLGLSFRSHYPCIRRVIFYVDETSRVLIFSCFVLMLNFFFFFWVFFCLCGGWLLRFFSWCLCVGGHDNSFVETKVTDRRFVFHRQVLTVSVVPLKEFQRRPIIWRNPQTVTCGIRSSDVEKNWTQGVLHRRETHDS